MSEQEYFAQLTADTKELYKKTTLLSIEPIYDSCTTEQINNVDLHVGRVLEYDSIKPSTLEKVLKINLKGSDRSVVLDENSAFLLYGALQKLFIEE